VRIMGHAAIMRLCVSSERIKNLIFLSVTSPVAMQPLEYVVNYTAWATNSSRRHRTHFGSSAKP
jgi:hypothetical protein